MDNNQFRNDQADSTASQTQKRLLKDAVFSWHQPAFFTRAHTLLHSFSPAERALLYGFSILLALSTFMLLAQINNTISIEQPSVGGSLTEGIVGTPRFINPLLAISDPDRDLSRLIYSGLMRATPGGKIVPNLASTYTISNAGATYTFTIRENAVFHDGSPVTAEDVVFTIRLAQMSEVKSPKRADWEGVAVEALDEHTVQFTLPRPYAPFIENATLGIMPQHLWKDIPPDELPFHPLNTRPIGSGPYKISRVKTDSSGAPVQYILTASETFVLNEPYIQKITLRFFANEDDLLKALSSGAVESAAGITPAHLKKIHRSDTIVRRTTLPRTFAVFFNRNNNDVFAEAEVREALDKAIDKKNIISVALGGFGTPLDSPVPLSIFSHVRPPDNTEEIINDRANHAREILSNNGWEQNEESGIWEKGGVQLSLTLTTADVPELVATAEEVARMWRAIGVDVHVEIFALNDLNTNIIRPREYEALLFGEIVGRTLDLFAFWHSSQRSDPGLNLALYTNSAADALLSDARVETDTKVREEKYAEFVSIVEDDMPAIFLYAPDFIYMIPSTLHNVALGTLTTPDERFLNVHEWYTETERVWEIFQ